ncbi:MAG TPA: NADH-quinone oxidoreductase subunit M, partial [Candidatus Binatia bacterium]|nr:NADH-quinone oxidoreductase subunit M [Candidatus Binatia bacterium]
VIENPKLDGISDLDAREWITFIPLVIATLVMGLAPSYVLDFTRSSAEAIAALYAAGVQP